MQPFDHKVRDFYGGHRHTFFEKLYEHVNRQALAPFFRPWVDPGARVLDAGAGSGHLASVLGIRDACFLDLTWERIRDFPFRGTSGGIVQADVQRLPFGDDVFDQVICSNVLHYTGLPGFRELLRITRPGGLLMLAFLESSVYTRATTRLAAFWGWFPQFMRDARLIDLEEINLSRTDIVDSATVAGFPPVFRARRLLPRQGLVAMVLRKSVNRTNGFTRTSPPPGAVAAPHGPARESAGVDLYRLLKAL
jgi:SAM-dependent methyltransferase